MGDVTFEIQLGSCFYGGLEEDAVYVGRKPNESGWISVCEDHKQQAEGDGYELMEPKTQAQESPDGGRGEQRDDDDEHHGDDDDERDGDRDRDREDQRDSDADRETERDGDVDRDADRDDDIGDDSDRERDKDADGG